MHTSNRGTGTALPLTIFAHNETGNEVVACRSSVCLPWMNGGSVNFELCLPIDLMNALENDQEFKAVDSSL